MPIHPFSILDTRTKEWKDKKNWWITNYKIQSELGRENIDSKTMFWETESNVSIFDPTLCELMYNWYIPKNGKILDPFAGGSVRGIVAEELGYKYTGIDISKTQVNANKLQSDKPNWIVGDSRKVLDDITDEYDFIFTCPPYHDLEIYSDNPRDISNMSYQKFLTSLNSILNKSVSKLKDNRFVGIVISEIRDSSSTRNYKIGKYRGFVPSVIEMCEKMGLSYYNDIILYNSQHQASRVANTYFGRNKKVASVHQNVLIFVKGNPDIATEEINGGIPICQVHGKQYLTFRHAAISIDPNELVGSEVERRCKSTKSKYKDWQIIGNETKPNIKYEVGGVPFESPIQISKLCELNEMECRNRIESNNPIYRHWKKVDNWDISYEEMDELWECGIELEKPAISCEGIDFLTTSDAAKYFNLSSERIRQKLQDTTNSEYIYLYK
ncbi:MAG: class I SAM-dependent methyltransferase [Flavobacteriales bacterium]|nr:class I SAM-dependent methyltransferase [Flavobacteriales bacterium]